MTETGVLIDRNGLPFHWHLPPGRTGGSLPDSRDLWDVIWEERRNLLGFAHSHPGSGVPGPSHTDLTTFAAVEAALGRRLFWWITSSDRLIRLEWDGPGKLDYEKFVVLPNEAYPRWVTTLRHMSTNHKAAP